MDRQQFFGAFFRAVGKEAFELIEGTAVEQSLDRFVESVEPARAQQSWERPPGAIKEAEFLQTCTGCDQCMQACPVNVIMIDNMERRDPIIYPEKDPCIHCDGYPCIAVCPTGALQLNTLSDSLAGVP